VFDRLGLCGRVRLERVGVVLVVCPALSHEGVGWKRSVQRSARHRAP
jgi:hypothetical protein